MDALPSSSGNCEAALPSPPYEQTWIRQQDMLRRNLIIGDDFCWASGGGDGGIDGGLLRYVGGVDVSFVKDDPSVACGALVVVDLQQRGREAALGVVHEAYEVVRLRVPYVPGFLAFREAPILLRLLEKTKHDSPSFYPQILMIDGNGILHPRGFGLASHLGVLADLPTIGVGKNLHHVDGLTLSRVRQLLEDPANASKDVITLTGDSGQTWGVAMWPSPSSIKPIFISVGHRISLESCIKIVKMCSKYRVPEPVRLADIKSRQHLRCMQGVDLQCVKDKLENHETAGRFITNQEEPMSPFLVEGSISRRGGSLNPKRPSRRSCLTTQTIHFCFVFSCFLFCVLSIWLPLGSSFFF